MKHVLSYLRVSSKGQVEGDGFPRQREAIEKWATAQNLTIHQEFAEEGVSGTTDLLARPALTRLFEAVTPGTIVVVEKADRLARDLIVSEVLLREFRTMDVTVIEAESGNDLTENDNPTAKLIRQILAAVAEFDKSSTVRKLKSARDRKKAATGRCEGVKPFGHTPEEQSTLTYMLQLRSAGLTVKQIAYRLNAQNVFNPQNFPTRSGKPWRPATVAKILARQ